QGLSGLVVVTWAAFVSDPLGGEPTAVVATKLAPSTQTARESDGDVRTVHRVRAGPLRRSCVMLPNAAPSTWTMIFLAEHWRSARRHP
ncbi:MAG: hypothetical protein WA760_11890, partial [Pseudolabrys sp.]